MNNDRFRLCAVALSIFLFFAILIVHYYQIQIVESEHWSKEAKKQHFFIVKEPFTRGSFYSNSAIKRGHPEKSHKLVFDIEKFHLFVDPESIPLKRKKEISVFLTKYLDLTHEESGFLLQQLHKKSRSRKAAMWLDSDAKETIMNWWNPYARKYKIPRNALYFVSEYQRSYPFGKLLGQVLHTVQHARDEKTSQSIPTGGLELYFHHYLKGKVGKRRLMRSPRNSLETGEVIVAPENGSDIYLTLNYALQAIVEEELEKGVKKCKAKAGWAVMMNPHNGEILALAQYPFFYPADYQRYFNDSLLVEHTKVKAVTDANEFGSVMKPITLAIAFLANCELQKQGKKPLFSPEEKISTASGHFPGRGKPITDTHPSQFLNMDMAIRFSSNIYVARLVERIIERLGADWYRNLLVETFGFGRKTGIELPSESSGVVPMPGKKHPNGTLEWSTSTPFSIAFGHNLQANSIQMLTAWAIICNGGYKVQPSIVKKIIRFDSTEILLKKPPKKKILDSKICERIVIALKYATKFGGTSRKGDIWGYTEAGKSSTAKKIINGNYSETVYIPSFIGFAPCKNPAFLLLITMDEPEYGYIPGWGKNHNGGTCCASVFREIGRRTLEYLGIAPDDPYGYPIGDPRHDAKKADWVAEVEKLSELHKKWNHS